MAVNLVTKYSDKIEEAFKLSSLLAGRLSTDYSFTGAKTVKMIIPQTVPMSDYTREGSNRYGNPSDMQDIVQELTMTQDKSFSLVIDKGDNGEQGGIKEAGKMLALQLKEQAVPAADKYGFEMLAKRAGIIVQNPVALNKSNIVERIATGTETLDNAEVPADNRTLFITAEGYKKLRLSPEFIGNDTLGKAALAKGQVGEFDGMAVVKVPLSRMPENVNFIIVQKYAATFPQTLNEAKVHKDPPGISGNLLEGRQIYDLFVYAAKCNGVYAEVNTADGKGVVCATPVINSNGSITTETEGATIAYTTDGSDPRYSDKVQYGNSVTAESGCVVKAYAYKDGAFPSAVAENTL